MPPNIVDMPVGEAPENVIVKPAIAETNGTYITSPVIVEEPKISKGKIICLSTMNLVAHILIGATVMISFVYSLRSGLPITATPIHVILCVVGYQLFMAEAILSLAPENGWTHKLNLVEKRRAHWILQLVGSILAIAGCFVKILDKSAHWNTLHGQFALVALVFTVVSLVNGLVSHYSTKFPRCIGGTHTKLGHICFGTVAFVTASISLCYGFDKGAFRNWLTPALADTFIAFTAIFTFIIIVPPFFTFYRKSSSVFSR